MPHDVAPLLWQPAPARVQASRLEAFRRAAEVLAGAAPPDYPALHQWSVRQAPDFWRLVWGFCGVLGDPGDEVRVAAADRLGAHWFPAARLNFAENLLRGGAGPALLAVNDQGRSASWSHARLTDTVLRLRAGFEAAGLRPGDRVAALLPNLPETVALMLAVTSLGGVWTSASPDFGAQGVLDRFGQVEPRWLLGVDAYSWKGNWVDCLDRLREVRAGLPTVEGLLVVPNRAAETDEMLDLDALPDSVDLRLWLENAPVDSAWKRFPFDIRSTSSTPAAPRASPSACFSGRAARCSST